MKINKELPPLDLNKIVIRSSELDYILRILSQYSIVLINGVGGIGKTTIARIYIEFNKEKYKNHVWHRYHELTAPNKELRELINDLNSLDDGGIVVIDDLDKQGLAYFSALFGTLNSNWHVILISRETISNIKIPVLTIGGLTKSEVNDLFRRMLPNYYEKVYEDFESNKMLEFIKNHPLAIVSLINLYKQNPSMLFSDFSKAILSNPLFTLDLASKPIEIYLDTNNRKQIDQIYGEVVKYLARHNLKIKKELPDEKGSWFKKMFAKANKILSSEDFKKKLSEADHSLKLHTITKQQSEVDKNQAEAVSRIINSLNDIPNAVIKIGSLLIIKTAISGNPHIAVKSLSIEEILLLENKPSLLQSPVELLANLGMKE